MKGTRMSLETTGSDDFMGKRMLPARIWPAWTGPARTWLGLVCCVLVLSGTAMAVEASKPEPSRAQAEAQVLRGMALGQDVSTTVTRLVEGTSSASHAMPPRSRAAAQLGATFERLAAATAGTPNPESLSYAFEAFEAQDLLVRREMETARATLEGLGIGGEVLSRMEAAQSRYLEASDRLHESLGAPLAQWRQARSGGRSPDGGEAKGGASLVSARAAVAQGAAQVRDLLAQQRPPEPVSLLRAAPLPYRRSELGPRTLQIPQTIQPSYLDPLAAQPLAEDLAPTVEAPLSEAILSQALTLGYDAVAIFEFVRNSIAPELYAGGMKGAEGTLRQGSGNDVDQASLLIALLRASRVPARYVRGVVELSVEQMASELGLVDPQSVPSALGKAGLAFRPVIRGGRVAAVEMEQTWVAAFVPYTNYRGAVVDFSGRTWVPLAPALKLTARLEATGILAQMGFSAASFETAYLGSAQRNSPLAQIRVQVEDYLLQEAPGETYAGQLGSRSVVTEELGLLPSSLPMKVVAVTEESAALRPEEVTRARIIARTGASASSPVGLDIERPLSEFLGERVTLSYTPAEVEDHRTVNAYGGLYAVPVYLIRLRPQLKIAGRPVDVGEGVLDMGIAHRIEVQLTGPWGTETISQTVLSGSYHALALGSQKSLRPDETVEDPGDTEHLGAQLLSQIAHGYGEDWDAGEEELAGLLNVEVLRPLPSVAMASLSLRVEELLGLPYGIEFQGVTLDAALRVAEPLSRVGEAATPRDWMKLSALHGSALENLIFAEQFQVESISADKGLGLARDLGIEVLRLNSTNLPSVLPTLAHPQVVKDDIANWVRLGLTVEVPRSVLTLNAWTGSVWRAEEASTGSSGFFIAGRLAGGSTSEPPANWVLDFLADALASPYSAEPNTDPLSAVELVKIPAGDGQEGEVGQEFDVPLAAFARDVDGRPVVGAAVTFIALQGGGTLIDEEGLEGGSLVVLTNALGIAEVTLRSGEQTSANPWYVRRNGGDRFSTQALMNFVEVVANSSRGALSIREPFAELAFPGDPASLRRTDTPSTQGVPGTWSDSAIVSVEDSFGNSISNIPVTFSVGTPTDLCDPPAANPQNGAVFDNTSAEGGGFRSCGFRSPLLGECGSGSYTEDTSRLGTFAGFILGNASQTMYRYDISAPGVPPLSFEILGSGSCHDGPRLRTAFSTIVNRQGQNINAAKPGEVSRSRVPVTIFYSEPDFEVAVGSDGKCFLDFKPTRTWVRTTATVNFDVSNGGSAGGITRQGDGSYEGSIRTGLTPGVNEVTLDATDVRVVIPKVDRNTCVEFTEEGLFSVTGSLSPVFGLKPTVERVTPDPVVLLADGRSKLPLIISYLLNPASYPSESVEVDLFEDGSPLGTVIGDSLSGPGNALISRGVHFDIAKTYEAEPVVNRGSLVEVRGDRFELPLFQRLFQRVPKKARVSQEVDLLNQRVCAIGSAFDFTITQDARLTLKFIKINAMDTNGDPVLGSETILIDNELFPEGSHSRSIRPTELLPGDYIFEFSGISEVDGHSETVQGKGSSEFTVRDSLPVGHAMYQDVDLFDGHLSFSRLDLEIEGRGVHLRLLRSYSSNSSGEPGPLGVGWSHNYDSKIVVNPCGEVIVVGAAGAGMRFVDDGAGGLKPLKGFHGSLVANPADGSFDFFTKNGTRYHYEFDRQQRWSLEFIEDPNGNQTILTYDVNPSGRKLISVADAGGRTLSFTYEEKFFLFQAPTDVVVGITGPSGLSMTYEYDDFGNLIRASREGGIQAEEYSYDVAPTSPLSLRNKLIERRDGVTQAVTTTAWMEDVIRTPDGGSNVITVPSVFVISTTLPEGGTSSFTFDLGGLTNRGQPELITQVQDPRNNEHIYTLNQYGSPLSIRDPLGNTTTMTWAPDDVVMTSKTNPNGTTTTFIHDEHANVLSEAVDVTDAGGTQHTYTIERSYFAPETFDPPHIKNKVRTFTDRNGNETRMAYDLHGNLVRDAITVSTVDGGSATLSRSHTYSGTGDRVATVDRRGFASFFTYDPFGNQASTTNPEGGITRRTYDDLSFLTSVTDPNGNTTSFENDSLGRRTVTDFPSPAGASGPSRETTVWDDANRQRRETDAEGRTTQMFFDGERRLIRTVDAAGAQQIIEYDPAGNRSLVTNFFDAQTPRRDTVLVSDAGGRLVSRIEAEGKVLTFEYDPVGNQIRETLTGGTGFLPRVTERRYDELNRRVEVTRIVDGQRLTTRFFLDGQGNQIRFEDTLGRQTSYTYDELNRLIETVEPEYAPGKRKISSLLLDGEGKILRQTETNEPLDRIMVNAYDAAGRLVRHTDAEEGNRLYEYDAAGNLVRELDPRLNVREFEYDARNNRITERVQLRRVTVPARDIETSYRYDRVGNQTEIHQSNGNLLRVTYDGRNRILSRTDSLGLLVSYTYDGDGNRIQETNANGDVTARIFDGLAREIEIHRPAGRSTFFTYDVAGNKVSETDARGHRTTFEYDALDRLTRITAPAPFSYTSSFTYDAAGNKLTETDRRGNTTAFQYSDQNRVVKRTGPAPFNYIEETTYDSQGNVLTETDRRGIVTEFRYDRESHLILVRRGGLVQRTKEYDPNGNLRFDTDANGNITGFEYDERDQRIAENLSLAAITRFTRDDLGNVIRERDPEGRILERTYDVRQRLTSESNGAGETAFFSYDGNGNRRTTTDPSGEVWEEIYDAADRLIQSVDPLGDVTRFEFDAADNRTLQVDSNGGTTSFEYDEVNRRTAMVYPGGAREEYSYDANGNRTQLRDARGQIVDSLYDSMNRLQSVSYSSLADPSGDDLIRIDYAYDGNGHLTQATETHSGITPPLLTVLSFDDFDRLLATTDGFGRTIAATYDGVGNRVTLTDPDGRVTRYSYDALNRVAGVTLAQVGVTQYSYFRDSRLRSIAYPNGSVARYTYDAGARLERVENLQGTAPISTFEYAYDAKGNRSQLTETNGGAPEVTTYTYDTADRLTEVVYPDSTVTTSYDGTGNRISEQVRDVGGVLTADRLYTYDLRNRLEGLTDSVDPSQDVTYVYDANGNQSSKTQSGVTTIFRHDGRDRLVAVESGGSPIATFGYDYRGRRVRKEGSSGPQRFIYDGDDLLIEADGGGASQVKYDYGPGHLLTRGHATEQRVFYLFDGLGSVVNLSQPDGSLAARYHWDAWGVLRSTSGASTNPFGFTGLQQDEETGLYYALNRYYDPTLGRFLREDPAEDVDGPNLFLYTRSNPQRWQDPEGLALYAFDGTWNNKDNLAADEQATNVAKLYDAFDDTQADKKYYVGVGTGGGFDRLAGGATGWGARKRIVAAYKDLIQVYNGDPATGRKPDRNIDIVGFSRGSAEAREFANMIHDYGIPDLSTAHTVGRGRNQRVVYDRYFKSPEIRFMGIFDTVASMGIAGNATNLTYELAIPPNVQNVRHAVASDEFRSLFPLASAVDPFNPDDPRVIERVFRGAHSDLGGGYKEINGDRGDQLSLAPLQWIWKEGRDLGVPFGDLTEADQRVPDEDVEPHDSRYALDKIRQFLPRLILGDKYKPPRKVHRYYRPFGFDAVFSDNWEVLEPERTEGETMPDLIVEDEDEDDVDIEDIEEDPDDGP